MGNKISPVFKPSEEKGAVKTALDPTKYIDDDLFGYMDARAGKGDEKGKSTIRTSPIRVESLVALNPYREDLDYRSEEHTSELQSH